MFYTRLHIANGCAGIKRALYFRTYFTVDRTVSLMETGASCIKWHVVTGSLCKDIAHIWSHHRQ